MSDVAAPEGDKVYQKGATPIAISDETVKAIAVLRSAAVGTTITWDRFATEIGLSVDRVKPRVTSARNILERQGVFFAVVRGIGVKRIDSNQAVEHSVPDRMKRTRSAARKARRLISRLNVDELTDDNKMRAMGASTCARLAELATTRKSLDRLTSASGSDARQIEADVGFQRMAELHRGKGV